MFGTPSQIFHAASLMSRRSRRRGRWSWTFLTSCLTSVTLLSLAVLAYNKSWHATLVHYAAEHYRDMVRASPDIHRYAYLNAEDAKKHKPESPVRKALVLASYKKQDVSWLEELPLLTKGWEVFRYMSDDQDTTQFYPLANSRGREALAYLTFIIDNYHHLPDYVVFIHGHQYSWHQPEAMIDKIAALNLTAVRNEDYVSLRCQTLHGCNEDDMYFFKGKLKNKGGNSKGHFHIHLDSFWNDIMKRDFGEMPAKVGRRCCSQFAVSKKTILNRSLRFWKSFRAPLMRKEPRRGEGEHRLGLYYEMVWHIVMGKPPVYCPSKSHCIQEHFSNLIHCEGNDEFFKAGMGTDGHGWKHVTCINEMRKELAR